MELADSISLKFNPSWVVAIYHLLFFPPVLPGANEKFDPFRIIFSIL
jgi:hypothetical protein